jgi:HEAT repeat protein
LLGRTGAPRAAAELVGLVGAKDASLRLAAIDALGALGAGRATASSPVDDALVPLLSDVDPAVRLHASVALASSGGAKARQALVAKLDGGEELDRFALFEALGGVLARLPDDRAAARVFAELGVAAGPERDAVLEAAGRARVAGAVPALAAAAKSADADDRRAVAAVLAAQSSPAAVQLLRTLLADPEAQVRAAAAFALGTAGDASTAAILLPLVAQSDADLATNAAGALARLTIRAPTVASSLCPLLGDARPTVRANLLAGLANGHERCRGGDVERKLLADDPVDLVRANAARALPYAAAGAGDDRIALDKCAATDRSAEVARLCRPHPATPAPRRTQPVTVFVVGEGAASTPIPRAPFLLQYADGVLRAGVADRRGAAFDPAAPAGEVTLRRPPAP